MLFLVGTFVSVTVASGFLRIFLIKISAELSALASADLVDDIFAKVVSQRYSFHKRYNTSEVISLLSDKVSMVTGLLMSICSLFNSAVMLVFYFLRIYTASRFFIIINIVLYPVAILLVTSFRKIYKYSNYVIISVFLVAAAFVMNSAIIY